MISFTKTHKFIIWLAQSLENNVYSPGRERPPALRDHQI